MCCVMPPNSFSATFDLRIASSSDVLPWSTWPMTVTTGGRRLSCEGSRSSSSTTSPSTERISTSTLNLSATSLAAVGSSSSLTVAITPSSSSALITSPDLRRIFSASSPTVTDSGTRMSSRRTSTGGAGGSATATGASGAMAAGAAAAGAIGAGAGAGGAAGGAGGAVAAGLTIVGGAGCGVGRGGGAGAAGRDGETVTRGGANGPAGWRDGRGGGAPRSSGRNGTILGSGFFGPGGAGGGVGAPGAAGLGATGSGGGATNVGSGTISGSGSGTNGGSGVISGGPAGLGFTIVAAGLTSAGASSSTFVFFDREAGFLATASPDAAASTVSSVLGFGTRLGFGASGRSRPLPSFTRSAFASVLSRGLMARMPLWPISSAATMRSLLVTPSSLASSITLILAAATVPSPPYDVTAITSTFSMALVSTSHSAVPATAWAAL